MPPTGETHANLCVLRANTQSLGPQQQQTQKTGTAKRKRNTARRLTTPLHMSRHRASLVVGPAFIGQGNKCKQSHIVFSYRYINKLLVFSCVDFQHGPVGALTVPATLKYRKSPIVRNKIIRDYGTLPGSRDPNPGNQARFPTNSTHGHTFFFTGIPSSRAYLLLHGHTFLFTGIPSSSRAYLLLHGHTFFFMGIPSSSRAYLLLHGHTFFFTA